MHAPIEILYEESHFLLLNKPAGLFSQAAPGIPSVETLLADDLKRRDGHLGKPFVGLPHRLDRSTSGVMLIAKNARALKRLNQQFQSRKVEKFYAAVCAGKLKHAELQSWQDYVRKIHDQPRAEIVDAAAAGGKLALLEAFPVFNQQDGSLLLLKLHTGRMHQIRIQAASRGLPIVGDSHYGGPQFPADVVDTARQCLPNVLGSIVSRAEVGPIALHALRLEFRHPQNAKPLSVTAPLPGAWKQFSTEMADQVTRLMEISLRNVESGSFWPQIVGKHGHRRAYD